MQTLFLRLPLSYLAMLFAKAMTNIVNVSNLRITRLQLSSDSPKKYFAHLNMCSTAIIVEYAFACAGSEEQG